MKAEELLQTLIRLQKETKEGKVDWRLDVQTTEGNEEKYTVEEDGQTWTIDECYVSYYCKYRGKEFCMISYEMIHSAKEQMRTTNYVFMPPLGIRKFSLHTLLEYSVDADAVLISHVHMLWELLMELYRGGSSQVQFHISQANVNVEEDA